MYNKKEKNMRDKVKNWLKILLLCFLLCDVGYIKAQKAYTLDECIQLSLNNNLQVKNNQIDIQSTESRIKEAKSGFLPNVDLKGLYQYYIDIPIMFVPSSMFGGPTGQYSEFTLYTAQITQGSMQVSQILYNQKVFIGLKAAKTARNLSILQIDKTKEDLTYNVSATYYNLQVMNQNIVLLDSNIISLEKTVNINKSLQTNNILSTSTYKRLLINLENLKNERENLVLACGKGFNLLKFLMGIPISDSIQIMEFDNTTTPRGFGAENIDNRTDIKLLNEQVSLIKIDKKAALADYYPSIAGVYSYGLTGYNNEFSVNKFINDKWVKGSYVGLQLNIPIFSGFSRFQKVRQKEFEVLKAENSYELLKQSAQKEISDALNNYYSRINSLDNTKRSLELAQQLFDNAGIEFRNGLISITDLISAQNDLSNARNNYSNAMINLRLAELELKKVKGELINNK